jgi:hypothetical protein
MVLGRSSDRAGGGWGDCLDGLIRYADGVGVAAKIQMAVPSLIRFAVLVGCCCHRPILHGLLS